jgi:hypothetical protein
VRRAPVVLRNPIAGPGFALAVAAATLNRAPLTFVGTRSSVTYDEIAIPPHATVVGTAVVLGTHLVGSIWEYP